MVEFCLMFMGLQTDFNYCLNHTLNCNSATTALQWELFAFGECWDPLVSLSPCLPSQHIPPAILTHPCCPQMHSVFTPPPMVSSNPYQVSQMVWHICRDHSEYPLPSPLPDQVTDRLFLILGLPNFTRLLWEYT